MTTNREKTTMLLILSFAIAAAISGATVIGLAAPVFAGGDEKTCKDIDDNNCNDKRFTQKIREKNDCEIENTNKDDSSKNDNENELICVNEAQNLKDVLQEFFEEPLEEESE
jgi:ABC-type cobalt transport system substrate-binding protein